MFSSSHPIGQPSSSPFGSQSVFGSNNAGNNLFAPKPLGSTPPFSANTGTSFFGGTSTGSFGATQSSFATSSTPTFGSKVPAFGGGLSTSLFGGSSVSGQEAAFGGFGSTATQTTQSGSAFQAQTAFGRNLSGPSSQTSLGFTSTPGFGMTNTLPFGGTSTQTFGISNTGSSFAVSNTPAFGPTSFSQSISTSGSNIFGTTPFPSTGNQVTPPPFGSNTIGQSQQHGGSRVARYTQTQEIDGAKPNFNMFESVAAMPVYKDKSHEELRWEDYKLGDKGGTFGPVQPSGGTGTNATQWNIFGGLQPSQSSSSTTVSSPFDSRTSTFSPFGPSLNDGTYAPLSTNTFPSISNNQSAPLFPSATTFSPTNSNLGQGTSSLGQSSIFCPSFIGSGSSSTTMPPLWQTNTALGQNSSSLGQSNIFGPLSTGSGSSGSSTPSIWPSNSSLGQGTLSSSGQSNIFSPFSTSSGTTSSSTQSLWPSNSTLGQGTSSLGNSNIFSPFSTSSGTTSSSTPSPWPSNSTLGQGTSSLGQSNIFSPFSTSSGTNSGSTPSLWPSITTLGQTTSSLGQSNIFCPLSTGSGSTSSYATSIWTTNSNVGSSTSSLGQSNISGPFSTASGSSCSSIPSLLPTISQETPQTTGTFPSQNALIMQPAPVPSPFGTLPVMPQMSIGLSRSSHSIKYGISSMPVTDKPTPIRVSPLLTNSIRVSSLLNSRHLSQRKTRVPANIVHPKVPFYLDDEESLSTPTTDISIFPRTNPRELVISPIEKWPSKVSTKKTTPTNGTRENKNGLGKECIQTTRNEAVIAIVSDVDKIVPKLKQSDYYTEPSIEELTAKENTELGFCQKVKNFVIGRHGYGSIEFDGETDIRGLDINSHVQFNNREVLVYMDDTKKPPVGKGLNKPALVTLLNIKFYDQKTGKQYTEGLKVEKCKKVLAKKAREQGAEFVSYDALKGEWKFKVNHF